MWGLLLIASLVGAVEGQFTYQGEQQTLSSLRRETVYPGSTLGKTRLQELKKDGYSCTPKRQFVQCSKNLSPESLTDVYSPLVTEISFGPISSINQLSSGDHFVQYEADQVVSVNGQTFYKAMYYEFKDFVKVAVGAPEQTSYFSFVVTKNSLLWLEQKNVTENKWVFKTHLIQSTLQKIESPLEL